MTAGLMFQLKNLGIDLSSCTEVIATTKIEECLPLLQKAESSWNDFQQKAQKLNLENLEDEISFYKEVKPYFHYPFIYYCYLKNFIGKYSLLDVKGRQSLVRKYLRRINSFYGDNQGFLTYFNMHETHADKVYFSYQNELGMVLEAHQLNLPIDFGFQNRYDLLLTYYLAFREAEKFLKVLKVEKSKEETGFHSILNWTGSKSAFNELIYALHECKAINKGELSINQIIPAISSFFNLDPGDYYKSINEIKNRKKERTKFLNQLVATLEEKFDSQDGF